MRIGIPRGRLFEETETLVAGAFEASLTKLSRAGARVIDHDIEDLLVGMAEATSRASIASIEAAEIHADWLDSKASLFDPRVRLRIALSATVPTPAYIRMMRRRQALAEAMDGVLVPIDVLALPTTPVTAPVTAPLIADDALYFRPTCFVLRNTTVANQFDLTSISLPIPGCERPVGFMLVAPHGHDRKLLAVAAGIEGSLGRQPVKAGRFHKAHADLAAACLPELAPSRTSPEAAVRDRFHFAF